MRELRWPHGRAWIASNSAEWPIRADDWQEVVPDAEEYRIAASARGAASAVAVAVTLVSQNASGGSYFARLGGQLTPHESSVLAVRVRPPARCAEAADIREALREGLAAVPDLDRPSGLLDVAWFAVHEVDYKRWAWVRAAATMCRLSCADIAGMSDADAALLAAASAAWR